MISQCAHFSWIFPCLKWRSEVYTLCLRNRLYDQIELTKTKTATEAWNDRKATAKMMTTIWKCIVSEKLFANFYAKIPNTNRKSHKDRRWEKETITIFFHSNCGLCLMNKTKWNAFVFTRTVCVCEVRWTTTNVFLQFIVIFTDRERNRVEMRWIKSNMCAVLR